MQTTDLYLKESRQMEDCQYEPLFDKTSDDTRLLHVHPADSFHAPVACDLWTVSLDEKPEYAALSYIWGDSTLSHNVTCNERRLEVIPNLHSASRTFRQTGWQTLRADAICIDQSDNMDRSQQTALMRRIYTQALQIFVCLGEAAENHVLAIELGGKMALLGPTAPRSTNISPREYAQFGLYPEDHPAWKTRGDVFARPWFFRIWVIRRYCQIPVPWQCVVISYSTGILLLTRPDSVWSFPSRDTVVPSDPPTQCKGQDYLTYGGYAF